MSIDNEKWLVCYLVRNRFSYFFGWFEHFHIRRVTLKLLKKKLAQMLNTSRCCVELVFRNHTYRSKVIWKRYNLAHLQCDALVNFLFRFSYLLSRNWVLTRLIPMSWVQKKWSRLLGLILIRLQ